MKPQRFLNSFALIRLRRPLRWLVVILSLFSLAIVASPSLVSPVCAQGFQCPPGFNKWGNDFCMQSNCASVANAKLNGVGQCVCGTGKKECRESGYGGGFDPAKCKPECPPPILVACIDPKEPCPGEKPALVAPPAVSPLEKPPAPATSPVNQQPAADTTTGRAPSFGADVDKLLHDLEKFLAGQGVQGPDPAQTAAAGVAVSALIGAWVVSQLLAGADIVDLMNAVGLWQTGQQMSVTSVAPSAAGSTGVSASAPSTATGAATERIYSGKKAIDILVRAGIFDPKDVAAGHVMEPDRFHRDKLLGGKRIDDWVVGETYDNTGRKASVDVNAISGVKGIAWHGKPDGTIDLSKEIVIVVDQEDTQRTVPIPPAPTSTVTPTPTGATPSPTSTATPTSTGAPPTTPRALVPPKVGDAPEVYKRDPSKFQQCQDLPNGVLDNKPPDKPITNKRDVSDKLNRRKYSEHCEVQIIDPSTHKRITDDAIRNYFNSAPDNSFILLGKNGVPDRQNADHYLVKQNGRLYQVWNRVSGGQFEEWKLKDCVKYFHTRYVMASTHDVFKSAPYKAFVILRPPP